MANATRCSLIRPQQGTLPWRRAVIARFLPGFERPPRAADRDGNAMSWFDDDQTPAPQGPRMFYDALDAPDALDKAADKVVADFDADPVEYTARLMGVPTVDIVLDDGDGHMPAKVEGRRATESHRGIAKRLPSPRSCPCRRLNAPNTCATSTLSRDSSARQIEPAPRSPPRNARHSLVV